MSTSNLQASHLPPHLTVYLFHNPSWTEVSPFLGPICKYLSARGAYSLLNFKLWVFHSFRHEMLIKYFTNEWMLSEQMPIKEPTELILMLLPSRSGCLKSVFITHGQTEGRERKIMTLLRNNCAPENRAPMRIHINCHWKNFCKRKIHLQSKMKLRQKAYRKEGKWMMNWERNGQKERGNGKGWERKNHETDQLRKCFVLHDLHKPSFHLQHNFF